MCHPAMLAALLPAGAGGAAAAAGATAAAATAATAASSAVTWGTLLKTAGTVVSGVTGLIQGRAQSDALKAQAAEESAIGAIEASRVRQKFRNQIGQQTTELVGRGVRLDSPSALALAELAGREMAFEADATMSRRTARSTELTAAAKSSRATGVQALLRGVTTAGGDLLTEAPRLWPGFAS